MDHILLQSQGSDHPEGVLGEVLTGEGVVGEDSFAAAVAADGAGVDEDPGHRCREAPAHHRGVDVGMGIFVHRTAARTTGEVDDDGLLGVDGPHDLVLEGECGRARTVGVEGNHDGLDAFVVADVVGGRDSPLIAGEGSGGHQQHGQCEVRKQTQGAELAMEGRLRKRDK